MNPLSLAGLLGLSLACAAGTEQPAAAPPQPPATASPAPQLCAGRAPCLVASDQALAGGHLVQVELGEDASEPAYLHVGSCVPVELWWAATGKAPVLVGSWCNDGYGAAMVGEDTVEVKEGVLSHTQVGGSGWKWGNTEALRLDTLQLVESSGWYGYGPSPMTEYRWDWPSFSGEGRAGGPHCEGDEEVDTPYRLIPQITLEGFDWRQHGLGDCALRLDASGPYVTHGEPGAPEDARLSAVLEGQVLYLEVHDDRLVSGRGSAIYDDHVELWGTLGVGDGFCLGDVETKQWLVALDGEVQGAHGNPPPLSAEAQALPDGARLRVVLPDTVSLRSVVYSDNDSDSDTQERLVASSPVRFGRSESLGELRRIDPTDAVCAVQGGALSPVQRRVWPTEPPGWPSE